VGVGFWAAQLPVMGLLGEYPVSFEIRAIAGATILTMAAAEFSIFFSLEESAANVNSFKTYARKRKSENLDP